MVHWLWDEVWIRPELLFLSLSFYLLVYQILIAVRGAWSHHHFLVRKTYVDLPF